MRFKIVLIVLFVFAQQLLLAKINIDSLEQIISKQPTDSAQIDQRIKLAKYLVSYDPKNGLLFVNKALAQAVNAKNKKLEGNALVVMSDLKIATSDIMGALEAAMQASAIFDAIKDEEGKANALHSLGNNYYKQEKNEKALEYFDAALKIRERYADKGALANTLNNLGIIYTSKKNTSKALEYLTKAMNNYNAIGDKDGVAASSNNIGLIYIELGMWSKAMEYFQRTFMMAKQLGTIEGQAIAMINIGRVYLNSDMPDLALSSFKIALKHAETINDLIQQRDIYFYIAEAYEKKLDFVQAYQSLRKYADLNSNLYTSEYAQQLAEMESRYQKERYQKQIELLNKDKEIQQLEKNKAEAEVNTQRIIIWAIAGILLVVLGMGLVVYRNYKEKQKANQLLEVAYSQIELKNKLITDSIDSAKTIQETILPATETVSKSFNEHFIFYQPKDIVSGDFYWLYQNESTSMLAVADCTGHGIPGAFMTFLGFNLLENAVKVNRETDPKNVLTVLDKEMQSIFTNNATVKGGMDMALIRFNKNTNQLIYSGAKNPVYVVRNGQLEELKAGKGHIGSVSLKQYTFEDREYQLQSGDMVYLFTDGFADQIGGDKKEKFFYQPFRELLVSVASLPLEKQKQKISETFNSWKGSREQTDDVLVFGVRV